MVIGNCLKCLKAGAKKQCSECQLVSYCSRKCQLAHWKKHKHICCKNVNGTKLLNTQERDRMASKIFLLHEEQDHDQIISHAKYLEQLLLQGELLYIDRVLKAFSFAYHRGNELNPSDDNLHGFLKVDGRRTVILGALNKFDEQGSVLVSVAFAYYRRHSATYALEFFEKARQSCLKSYSIDNEVESAIGLGIISLEYGIANSMGDASWESGIAILRSAAFAASLISDRFHLRELFAMRTLVEYLLRKEDTLQEAKERLFIYGCLANSVSVQSTFFSTNEVHSYLLTAKMHAVIHIHNRIAMLVASFQSMLVL